MIQSFIAVFIPAFIIEVFRYNFLPFSKLFDIGFNKGPAKEQASKKVEEQENLTELEKEIKLVQNELKDLYEESERYNNPENYTKYAKMQRQLVQKQKVLQIMINENEQEKQKRQAEKANADEPSNIKQQKQEVRESKQSTSNFQINTTRLIITGVYLLFFYGGPIFILPNTLPLNKNLYKSFVNENQIGSLMYSLLGGSLDFRGSSMYFFTFREIFIFSIVVSYKIIDALRPINM